MNVTMVSYILKHQVALSKKLVVWCIVTLQAVTNVGAVTSNDITLNGANLVFEGYLENAYETTLMLLNLQVIEQSLYQIQTV